ncbi:MAG: hypothetical protein ACFFER_04270 [Candidatus Thorarchaeota archaeon]
MMLMLVSMRLGKVSFLRKIVQIVYNENPKLKLDVAVYYPDSSEYRIQYIHLTHHAEVENISKLLTGGEFNEPKLLTDWHGFMNALRMLPDQYIRSLDVIYLTRSGEVIEDSE